jgi:peptidoglycan endopeptidase LytE
MIHRMVSVSKRTALLISLIILCFASNAHGAVKYTIKKGDNLSKIAKRFRVSTGAIRKENGMSSGKLMPGAKIVIPVREASARKRRKGRHRHDDIGSKSVKPDNDDAGRQDDDQTVQESAPSSQPLYHVVKRGETLRSIAKNYSITVAELKEINGLKSVKVRKGRKLLVKRIGPKTYIVKRGDNIWKIAKKFDMDANDLMEMNEMGSPEIKTGQKLYLEQKVDTTQAETYKEKVAKIEEDLKVTAASEDFAKEDPKDKVITFAKKLLNIPYKFGGNSILGIDCSAYVKKVYGLLGVNLPRTAREQFKEGGEALDKDQLSIGDLVFFRTYASFPSHVGIYLGNNLFIHASSRGKKVTIDSLETPYYLKRFIGGKRFLTDEDAEADQQN